MRTSTVLFTILTLFAASSASAHTAAPGAGDVLVERVSTAGLDLRTEAGAAQFLGRLGRAADEVCGGAPPRPTITLQATARFKACRAQALSRAVAQVQSDVLRRQFAATKAGHAPVRVATN